MLVYIFLHSTVTQLGIISLGIKGLVLVQPRKTGKCPKMTEKLLTRTIKHQHKILHRTMVLWVLNFWAVNKIVFQKGIELRITV